MPAAQSPSQVWAFSGIADVGRGLPQSFRHPRLRKESPGYGADVTFRRVVAAVFVIGLVLLWLATRRRPKDGTGSRLGETEAGVASDDMGPRGVAFEQIAPPPDDERVERLRARVAAGGTLTEEEESFCLLYTSPSPRDS